MSEHSFSSLDDYPPSLLIQLDEVCDRFEFAWKSGQRPRIEDYLLGTPEPRRALLLRELLGLELEYRRGAGEQPNAEEYRARFPNGAAPLRDAFPEPSAGPENDASPPVPVVTEDLGTTVWQAANGAAPAPPVAAAALPADYELLGLLGRGGMGIVYRAWQRSARRVVALKVIRPDKLAELSEERRREWLTRFRREAQAAARLDHPNVIPIYDVGGADSAPYYSMRFVAGQSLAALVRARVLTNEEAAGYVGQAAGALHAAHAQGVFHRDLKPCNILVDADGRPYVVDFGLARWVEGGTELTRYGDCIGTPPYMPPEQVRDATQVSARSDVYSLGATLYELLTGRPPFRAANMAETLCQVIQDDPVPPRRLNPAVARDLETICLTCLRKEPDRRYVTAAALADDLGRYLRKEPIQARPLGFGEALVRWARRKPALATVSGLLMAAALLLVAATVGLVVQQQADLWKSRQNAARATRDLGLSYCDKGDVPLGLLHLARALELAPPEDEELQRTIRTNLACWGRQSALLAAPPIRAEADVAALALSPDGERVLLGGPDAVARVLELATGTELFRLRGHSGPVTAVAWGPTGADLFTGSGDGTVRIWSAADGAPRGQVEAGGRVQAIACGPGGRTFATGGNDGRARLWDTATRHQLQVFKGPPGSARVLALSPDGTKLLTSGGNDKAVRLWDTASGDELLVREGHAEPVNAAAFSPDGRFFVTGSMDHSVRLWNTTTGEMGEPIRTAGIVDSVTISPDGLTLLTGGSTRSAQLWDVATGHPLGLPLVHRAAVTAVAFGPQGKTLVTAEADGTLRLWQAPARADLGRHLAHEGWVAALAFSPDSTLLATGIGWKRGIQLGGEACLWELPAATRRPQGFRDGYGIRALAFSPDGLTLATGHSDRLVRLWDIRTGNPCGPNLEHDGWLTALAFSPDGQLLVTGCMKPNAKVEAAAYLWDVRNGQRLHRWPHADSVRVAVFHPDGRLVLTASRDGGARLWDTTTGNPAGDFPHKSAVNAAAFNHDGNQVVTAGADRTACLWDTATQQLLHELPHQGAVLAAVFSRDGAFVLTGGADGKARVWNARTGLPVGRPLPHEDEVYAVAFSPDGSTVLTGSLDNTARLWDRDTGTPLGPALRHAWSRNQDEADAVPGARPRRDPKGVRAVAFSPDGKWAATASLDSTARLWPTPGRLEGEAARVALWAQTATGLELDAHGVPRELPASTWHGRRQQLAQLGGPPQP